MLPDGVPHWGRPVPRPRDTGFPVEAPLLGQLGQGTRRQETETGLAGSAGVGLREGGESGRPGSRRREIRLFVRKPVGLAVGRSLR